MHFHKSSVLVLVPKQPALTLCVEYPVSLAAPVHSRQIDSRLLFSMETAFHMLLLVLLPTLVFCFPSDQAYYGVFILAFGSGKLLSGHLITIVMGLGSGLVQKLQI